MKRNVIIIVGLLLIIGLAAMWFASRGGQASSGTDTPENTGAKARRGGFLTRSGGLAEDGGAQAAALVRTSATRRAAHAVTGLDLVDDPNLSDADKQLVMDLQNALDDENLSGVAAAARKLMRSTSEPARMRAATALSWFGAAALPELIEMLSDPSEEVVETIMSATLDAIDEMDDDDPRKAELLAEYIMTLSDPDAIEDALMRFTGMEDEKVLGYLDALIARSQNDPVRLAALLEFRKFMSGDGFF